MRFPADDLTSAPAKFEYPAQLGEQSVRAGCEHDDVAVGGGKAWNGTSWGCPEPIGSSPTFFINGRRHHGSYDITTLSAEVRAARARAALGSSS